MRALIGIALTILLFLGFRFAQGNFFLVHQNEFAWFGGDEWTVGPRLSLDFGLRFDNDSITSSTHAAPRASLTLALTSDRRTLLKAGAGLFYDRVPLNAPAFPNFPDRTVLTFDSAGNVTSSVYTAMSKRRTTTRSLSS